MVNIKLKRVYEAPSEDDGLRVLVDRLWPRGVRREEIDEGGEWEKELAPSTELREWFHEDPVGRWSEFVSRYKSELKQNPSLVTFAKSIQKEHTVTFLYAGKDEEQIGRASCRERVYVLV